MFTAPPIFDVKNDALNDAILEDLGDAYEKKCKDLCVKATNGGIAWVHYWIDEDKNFQWATIPATQIVPVWNNHINTKLEGGFRVQTKQAKILLSMNFGTIRKYKPFLFEVVM